MKGMALTGLSVEARPNEHWTAKTEDVPTTDDNTVPEERELNKETDTCSGTEDDGVRNGLSTSRACTDQYHCT